MSTNYVFYFLLRTRIFLYLIQRQEVPTRWIRKSMEGIASVNNVFISLNLFIKLIKP